LTEVKNFLIIIINYNNSNDTIDCLNSLFESGIHSNSILVIDNGSKNDSLSYLIDKCPSVNIIKNKTNIGFAAANNIGLKRAISNNFSYAILLNNDTIVTPTAISELIRVMDKSPDVSLGTGQIRMYPEKNKIWYAGGKLIHWRGLAVHLLFNKNVEKARLQKDPQYVTFISGCYLCIRLCSIAKLGVLDERFFIYLEDVEYSDRAIKKGYKMLYVPTSVIYHKWIGGTKLKNKSLYYAIRNRNLLIKISFNVIAKVYFSFILIVKILFWYLTNKEAFTMALRGIQDYKKKYFGPLL
jgi:GT2 family glycosyltransferase